MKNWGKECDLRGGGKGSEKLHLGRKSEGNLKRKFYTFQNSTENPVEFQNILLHVQRI